MEREIYILLKLIDNQQHTQHELHQANRSLVQNGFQFKSTRTELSTVTHYTLSRSTDASEWIWRIASWGHSKLYQDGVAHASVHIAEFIHGICNHKPHSSSHVQIVCSRFYVVPATEAGRKPGNKTTRSVLKVNQNPAYLWLQVRSDESFCCGACRHAYVATTRSRRRVTCTRALSLSYPQSAASQRVRVAVTIEIVFGKNCRTYEMNDMCFHKTLLLIIYEFLTF